MIELNGYWMGDGNQSDFDIRGGCACQLERIVCEIFYYCSGGSNQ